MSIRTKKKISDGICIAVFLFPVLFFLAVYLLYPIIATFINSLHQWNGISAEKTFLGLANWIKLIRDSNFWKAALNNVKIMVLSLVIQMPIGILLATYLDAVGKKGNAFKAIWFLPMLMSSVAIGYLFRYALATNGGLITSISQLFGGARQQSRRQAPGGPPAPGKQSGANGLLDLIRGGLGGGEAAGLGDSLRGSIASASKPLSDLLDAFSIDGEKLLILLVMWVIFNERSDNKTLLLALGYLLL